jgi:hypothetical protein
MAPLDPASSTTEDKDNNAPATPERAMQAIRSYYETVSDAEFLRDVETARSSATGTQSPPSPVPPRSEHGDSAS